MGKCFSRSKNKDEEGGANVGPSSPQNTNKSKKEESTEEIENDKRRLLGDKQLDGSQENRNEIQSKRSVVKSVPKLY